MIEDIFTKPLQGKLFKHFRDVVLGSKQMDDFHEAESNSVDGASHERVSDDVSIRDVTGDESDQ